MRSGKQFSKALTRWSFRSISSVLFLRSPVVAIRREGDAVRVSVNSRHFSRGFETKEVSLVESADVSKLISAIFATHADECLMTQLPFCLLSVVGASMGMLTTPSCH